MTSLYLVGMRGAGKSTTGKILAQKIGLPFLDLDHEVIQKAEESITDMVSRKGWDYFREKEREMLLHCLEKDAMVLSTGGGVLMFFDNAEQLKAKGSVILLTADSKTLAQRIGGSNDRPSLTGGDILKELETVWEEREATYRKHADLIIDTEGKTPEDVAQEIAHHYGE